MEALFILQFFGGLSALLAKFFLKNKKVAGWYLQGFGTVLYLFIFINKEMILYQVFSLGLILITAYGIYKHKQKIVSYTEIDSGLALITIVVMGIILGLKIAEDPSNHLAIIKMIAASFLIIGLRYLAQRKRVGWILIILSSILLTLVFSFSSLWIMASFQFFSTFFSIDGYRKFKKE